MESNEPVEGIKYDSEKDELVCQQLEKLIQKQRNSQIRPINKWWHFWYFKKKVYCTECEHPEELPMEMFGEVAFIHLCGIAEKNGSQRNRYCKNKKHNCKDFKKKTE